LLRSLIGKNPRNWENIIPLTEFANNSSLNRTANSFCFEVVYCKKPLIVLNLTQLSIFKKENARARNFIKFIQVFHTQGKEKIKLSKNIKYPLTNIKDKLFLKKWIWFGWCWPKKASSWVLFNPLPTIRKEMQGKEIL